MRKLDKAKRTLTTLSVGLGAGISALQSFWTKSVVESLQIPQSAQNLFNGLSAFIVVAATTLIIVSTTHYLLERYRFVRKIFLGIDFIEGAWVDIVYDQFKERVVGGGLLFIYMKEGALFVKGETFNADGTSGGQFLSHMSEYQEGNQCVNFVYSINLDKEAISGDDGLGQYSFHSTGKSPPRSFWGHFYANGKSDRYDVYGEKVPWAEEKVLAKMKLREKGQFVAQFIAENQSTIVPQEFREERVEPCEETSFIGRLKAIWKN